MKHSAQIKFPTKFLIASLFILTVSTVLTAGFIYLSHNKSLEKKDSQSTAVVEQLDKSSYNQALDSINNK